MAKRFKLRDIERDRGINLKEEIPKAVNEKGQEYAAKKFGVSTATISRFMQENGYVAKVIYVKQEAQPC